MNLHRLCQRQPDADYELRQSLIDLAAIAEIIAADLAAPNEGNARPDDRGRMPDLRG